MSTARVPLEVQRVVRDFRRRLSEHFGSRLSDVRLFGSYARGAAHEDSDVDVFVLLDRMDYVTQRDVLNIAGDLFFETNLLVSPSVFGRAVYEAHRAEGRPLISEIEEQGVRL
jgi:uncharacterized protein